LTAGCDLPECLEEDLVGGAEGGGQPFGHFLADGAAAVLHLGDVPGAAADTRGQGLLGHVLAIPGPGQHMPGMPVGKGLGPGDGVRIGRVRRGVEKGNDGGHSVLEPVGHLVRGVDENVRAAVNTALTHVYRHR